MNPVGPLPPFVYGCVFWGAEYRNYFLRYCLASLLSPRNIPGLSNRAGSRFIVCTGRRDWEACLEDPTFQLLQRHISPEFVELPADEPTRREESMARMSWGHRMLTQQAFESGACGIILNPDSMLSDGSLLALAARLQEGDAVILAPALRFRMETLVSDMEARGLTRPGVPLTLTGRELAAIALRHLHSETYVYQWETRHYWEPPVCSLWQGPDRDGLIIHGFSWGAMLVDYRRLQRHDTRVFENSTMDGDYVYANFGASSAVTQITDSDEFLMVSLTSEASFHLPRYDGLFRHLSWTENMRKGWALRQFMFSPVIDDLKRKIFMIPARLHSGPITGAWLREQERVSALLRRICRPPDWRDALIGWTIRRWRSIFGHPRELPEGRSTFADYLRICWFAERVRAAAFCADGRRHLPAEFFVTNQRAGFQYTNTAGVGTERILRIPRALSAGRWYWEAVALNASANAKIRRQATFGFVVDSKVVGWRADGCLITGRASEPLGDALGAEDVLMLAVDAGEGSIWFGRNGRWFGDGDPARGMRPAFACQCGELAAAVSSSHTADGAAILEICLRPEAFRHEAPAGFRPLGEAPIVRPSDTPQVIAIIWAAFRAIVSRLLRKLRRLFAGLLGSPAG